MHWSVPVGKVKGTIVQSHFTFLIFLAWIVTVPQVTAAVATAPRN